MEELVSDFKRGHKLTMQGRENLKISGVEDVISFDDNQIILETTKGRMTIKGEGLHVRSLNLEKGEVDVDGKIDQIQYSSSDKSARMEPGFWAKIFS